MLLDVGTSNAALREAPEYGGLRQPRLQGAAYAELVDEFVSAAQQVYGPSVLVHWEDFGNENAFALLERYRSRAPSFNDDIQSTAAVALAAVLGACRLPGVPPLTAQTFLLIGAGQASLGIAALLVKALAKEVREGVLEEGWGRAGRTTDAVCGHRASRRTTQRHASG